MHTLQGKINRGISVFVPGLVLYRYGRISFARINLILPGFIGTSTLSLLATLTAPWLHEPQPISFQPVGLGFPHRAERYRPGGSAFSSPICWSCRDMEMFVIRGWDLSFPRMRWDLNIGQRANSRHALAPYTPANQQSASGVWGFHTAPGGIAPGNRCFCRRVGGVVEV